jgi:hypothetical protein
MTDYGGNRPMACPRSRRLIRTRNAVCCLIQTFYAPAIRLAQCRGRNIDLPQKVTRTR